MFTFWLTLLKLKIGGKQTRCNAVERLGSLGMRAGVKPLLTALSDQDSHLRMLAVRSLGKLKDPRAVAPLIAALQDSDDCVRRDAANALGELGSIAAVEPLMDSLNDLNAQVRYSAVSAIGCIGSPVVVDRLIGLLDDESLSPSVGKALGMIGDSRAALPICKALETGTIDSNSIKAVAKLGDPRAIGTLVRCLRRSAVADHLSLPGYVCDDVCEALASFGSEAVDALLNALEEPYNSNDAEVFPNAHDGINRIREKIAQALGMIGDRRAMPNLIKLARDSSAVVRISAAEAICIIGDPVAIKSLGSLLRKDDHSLTVALARAKVGDCDEVRWVIQMATNHPYNAWADLRRAVHTLEQILESAAPHVGIKDLHSLVNVRPYYLKTNSPLGSTFGGTGYRGPVERIPIDCTRVNDLALQELSRRGRMAGRS